MGKHLAYKGGGCIFKYFTLFLHTRKRVPMEFTAKLATFPNEATSYRSSSPDGTLNSEQQHAIVASEHD